MPAYFVRTIRDHDLVGIFVARDAYELALIVDEYTGVCEGFTNATLCTQLARAIRAVASLDATRERSNLPDCLAPRPHLKARRNSSVDVGRLGDA
jgi:hypothetical protein